MKHTKISTLLGSLLLAIFIITGCTTPPATPTACPTSAPQTCPTAAAQGMPVSNSWRYDYSTTANVMITFEPGDKCSMEVLNPINGDNWGYEIVADDQTYQNYVVVAMTLDPGKTLADLQKYGDQPGSSLTPPPFSQLKTWEIVNPMSRTFHGVTLSGDKLYFVCIVQGPGDQKAIGEFGPVQLVP